MADNRPIGVLDSGFGGLSIVESISKLLPEEEIVFYGDNSQAPYGKKSPDFIIARVEKIIKFLIDRKVKLIVIACNTATVLGLDFFRKKFPKIPFVGVVPVIKTAAEITPKGKFAILETSITAKSIYQKNLLNKFASKNKVIEIACDELVVDIEKGKIEKALIDVNKCLSNAEVTSGDVLVLGCTHFVFIKEFLQKSGLIVLDSGGAVARQVERLLEDKYTTRKKGKISYFTSGVSQDFIKVSSKLSKLNIEGVISINLE